MKKIDLTKLLNNKNSVMPDCGPSHSCGGGGR